VNLCAPYVEADQLLLANIYIREAHPDDGWKIEGNERGDYATEAFGTRTKVCVLQTTTLSARLQVANDFHNAMTGPAKSVPLLVDDPTTNAIDIAYEAPPERLVVVHNGEVKFTSGQGPMQYNLDDLKEFLETYVGPKARL